MVSMRLRTAGGYLGAYVAAVVVGLSSIQDNNGLAYFWPATGVAALWLLRGRNGAQVALDGGLLLVATVVTDSLMGVPPVGALMFGCANLFVGLVVRMASSMTEGQLFTSPVPRRVAAKRDLWGVGFASVAGAVVSAPFGLIGARFNGGDVSVDTLAVWLMRTTCSTFVVTAAVLALLTALLRAHARRGWAAKLTSEPRRYWVLELLLAATTSLGATAVLFGSADQVPVAFLLMVLTTWIGYRFPRPSPAPTRWCSRPWRSCAPRSGGVPSAGSRTSPPGRSSYRSMRW